jgi:hypothetical protein
MVIEVNSALEKFCRENPHIFLRGLIEKNGDILWRCSNILPTDYGEYEVMSVFDYSVKHGGTVDSFQFYNDYVVLLNPAGSAM